MDQKIMSNVDDWMKISDKVAQDPQRGNHLVVDESTIGSSELFQFFMKYPEFSPLHNNWFKSKGAYKHCPKVSPDCPPSTYYISIKDLEVGGNLSEAYRHHSQTLSLFAFIFEKMSALEKQNVSQQKTLEIALEKNESQQKMIESQQKMIESQQKTLDFVCKKMSALEKQNESQQKTLDFVLEKMSALEKQNEIALEKQNEIALEKQNEIQQKTLEQMLEDECDAVFSR